MTEHTDTEPQQLAPVVPEGRDALDDLTVGELGAIGRRLGYDVYVAVKDPATGLRWEALGHVAHAWAKRTDPRAQLATYLGMTGAQVAELLRMTDDDDQVDDEDDAEANPTDCAGGSPSPAPGDSTPTP